MRSVRDEHLPCAQLMLVWDLVGWVGTVCPVLFLSRPRGAPGCFLGGWARFSPPPLGWCRGRRNWSLDAAHWAQDPGMKRVAQAPDPGAPPGPSSTWRSTTGSASSRPHSASRAPQMWPPSWERWPLWAASTSPTRSRLCRVSGPAAWGMDCVHVGESVWEGRCLRFPPKCSCVPFATHGCVACHLEFRKRYSGIFCLARPPHQ